MDFWTCMRYLEKIAKSGNFPQEKLRNFDFVISYFSSPKYRNISPILPTTPTSNTPSVVHYLLFILCFYRFSKKCSKK
jgi:hypothetical protein